VAARSLATTIVQFTAVIQRTKNRLVAIPADAQRRLGLQRRRDNHIVHVSIRRSGGGRWNHHYLKLTSDNEFAVPADITGLQCGDAVDVKVHRVIPDVALPTPSGSSGADLLLRLAAEPRPAWRSDGSTRLDEYLRAETVD
jgi:hypothetical protein